MCVCATHFKFKRNFPSSLQFQLKSLKMNNMNINVMGAGPINERLNEFHLAIQLSGRRVEFGLNKNVAAIKELYDLLQGFDVIPDDATQNAKSNKMSKKLRLEGNELFSSDNDLSKALELYNQSICWAEGTGEELAIGIANRSAVYFEWKKYDICLENIDLAVKAGCPERLMEKLNQRRADCVEKMNENTEKAEGSDGVDSKIHFVDTLCITMKDILRMKSKHLCFDVDQNRREPELSLRPNATIPFAAHCLQLKTSPQQGRYIVTTEALKRLKPGQIISIEEPVISSLEKEHRYRKCSNCFAENFMNLIPCTSCTCTMFCSEQCLIEAEKGFHQFECPIAEYIWNHCQEIALTLRLVVKAFTMFDSVQELTEFREENKRANVTAFSYDHRNGLSDKERYSLVENLYTGEEKRPEEDLFTRGCKVALLYHFLIEKTKFGEMLETELERDTLIALLFHYSQVTSINSFNCYQYDDVDIDSITSCKSSDIFSRGIYPLSSLFNHSCAPNVATIAVGTTIVTYVTRPINRNAEVLGCLKRLNHFQRGKFERQNLLKLIYGFRCKCEACQKNYPSVHDEHLPFGFVDTEIKDAVDAITFNLNEEVDNVDKFSLLLQKYSDCYPSGALYDIGWKLHRAMALKYGNLASQSQITLKKNQLKLSAALKK